MKIFSYSDNKYSYLIFIEILTATKRKVTIVIEQLNVSYDILYINDKINYISLGLYNHQIDYYNSTKYAHENITFNIYNNCFCYLNFEHMLIQSKNLTELNN